MTKTDMTIAIKENQRGVLNIGIFEFRVCFEFRASRFGFSSPMPFHAVVFPLCPAKNVGHGQFSKEGVNKLPRLGARGGKGELKTSHGNF